MKISNTLVWLSILILMLALVAAGVGLFYQDSGSPYAFTTLRGATVPIYGQGVYHYDTPIVALGNRVGDAVTLIVAIPLLVLSLVRYRRGALKGGVLLAGTLAYLLYYYGSTAFGTAYNNFFLLYVALFSASLFAFVIALTAINAQVLVANLSPHLPRRGIGLYLIVSGVVLMLVWLLLSVIPALLQGQAPPEVWSYTTVITIVVDEAIIVPTLILAGVLLLRRAPLGYLLASTLLVFVAVLGISLTAGGVVQLLAGVVTVGQFIGFTAGFSVLTLFALWFTFVLLRNFAEDSSDRSAALQAAQV